MGDTPKDFAILQSKPKMQQGFGKKVKVSLTFLSHTTLQNSLRKTVGKSVTDSGYVYVMQWF